LTTTRIGCLAWGSLLWDPRSLPRAGAFRDDGPRLPIEFSRVSSDGRVTLVIDPAAPEVTTWWAPLTVDSLEEAVARLGARERIDPSQWPRWVGRRSARDPEPDPGGRADGIGRRVGRWLAASGLEAVVWTALPMRGPGGARARPDVETLVAHLRSLEGEARRRAEQYIRRAPARLETPNRRCFEERLGWLPVGTDGAAS
jgi:hypothetical protein